MARVLGMFMGVHQVEVGYRYSWADRDYQPTITYSYGDSSGQSRSVTFGVVVVRGTVIYHYGEAYGFRLDSPVTQEVSNAWLDQCSAEGLLITS